MTSQKITYMILIFISMTSCDKISKTDEKVISEIFPQLIDSLRINPSNLIPPPPPPIYDSDYNYIGIDTIAAKQIIDEHELKIRKIDSIDSRLLIGLIDTCLNIDLVDLEKRTYSDSLTLDKIMNDNKRIPTSLRKWNLKLIKLPENYHLMLKSELNEKYSEIWRIDDRKFCGLIAVSKILYEKDKKTGLLQLDSYWLYHEGVSYFVIIERINGKWKVKKILLNWIS